MFDAIDTDERGQVGIGTLIIFIAMVLVAAVAAGVLINTAGLLESSASDTADDSQAEVSNQITVVSAVGEDADATAGVETLRFTVMKSPGAQDIDLADATVQYSSDSASATLEQAGSAGASAFAVTKLDGTSASDLVLDSQDERKVIQIDVNSVQGSDLGEGGEATVKFVDQSGATTIYGVNVPDTISGDTFVSV